MVRLGGRMLDGGQTVWMLNRPNRDQRGIWTWGAGKHKIRAQKNNRKKKKKTTTLVRAYGLAAVLVPHWQSEWSGNDWGCRAEMQLEHEWIGCRCAGWLAAARDGDPLPMVTNRQADGENRKQETKQGLFSSTSDWVHSMHIVASLDFLCSSFFFPHPGDPQFPPQSASQDIGGWQWDRLHLKCQQFAALHHQGKSTFMCKRRPKLNSNVFQTAYSSTSWI